uniref:NB-ARC domain-containing protein n=1 Tax=Lactuca sativa TaxID=4236 RepID=A0A9R1VVP8_LACSA|nr:hypothetical protein LSAT_V11C400215870 [Lactuca sativa]
MNLDKHRSKWVTTLSRSRLRTLNLGLAPNHEKLILAECKDLEKLHLPERCINLRPLLLTNSKLRTLDIGMTLNLEKLVLDKVSKSITISGMYLTRPGMVHLGYMALCIG